MAAKVASILNMKGGVGKTTIAAQVLRVLYYRKKNRVLLIDLDAQYNLTQSVITRERYDKLTNEGKTVLACFEPAPSDDFFSIKTTTKPPPDAKHVSITLRHMPAHDARLDIISGDFRLVKYSMIDDAQQLKRAITYFKKFVNAAKEHYDLIVLDCNPSSSFITRCALEVSYCIISPVRPDKYSILGIEMLSRLMQYLNLTIEQVIVMNGISRNSITPVESELRAHSVFGPRVLVRRLPQSKLLHADQEYTGFASDKKVSWSGTLRYEIGQLADELAGRLGV